MESIVDIYEGWNPINDYGNDINTFIAEADEENDANRLIDLMLESDLLVDAYKLYAFDQINEATGDVSIDDGGANNKVERVSTGIFSKISNFLGKMVNFMTDMLNKFITDIKNTFQSNDSFIKENYGKLTKLPESIANGLTVTAIPYWETGTHDRLLKSNLDPEVMNATKVITDVLKSPDAPQANLFDDFYKKFFPNLYKLDSKDYKHAVLMMYNGGTDPVTKQFSGNEAVNAVVQMANFMRDYHKYVDSTNSVVKSYTNTVNSLKKIVDDFQKKADSYAKLENEKRAAATKLRKKSADLNKQAKIMDNKISAKNKNGVNKTSNADLGNNTNNQQPQTSSFYYLDNELSYMLEGTNLANSELALYMPVNEAGLGHIATSNTDSANTRADFSSKKMNKYASKAGKKNNYSNSDAQSKHDEAVNTGKQAVNNQREGNKFQKEKNFNQLVANYANSALKCAKIVSSMASMRLNLCKQIDDHYHNVLAKLVDAVNQYERNTQRNEENIAYNQNVETNRETKHQRNMNQIQRNKEEGKATATAARRIKGKSKPWFARWMYW